MILDKETMMNLIRELFDSGLAIIPVVELERLQAIQEKYNDHLNKDRRFQK